MATPVLATKLYRPPPRPNAVRRPRLLERLNEGLERKVTLISAPAGFGKTTLVAEWAGEFGLGILDFGLSRAHSIQNPAVAWLSLDKGENDPSRFLIYLVAALQTIVPKLGAGVLAGLQAPQPPPIEMILTALANEINALAQKSVLVLDDYHLLEAKAVDEAVAFLVEHLPPQLHLVIATREDPALPLARWRARGQLNEVRAADLRFTPAEAAAFLNQVMDLNLSPEQIAALETRTEGWIAGLQLAALSLQGQADATSFIQSFTGSHHFVLDYLVAEVLQQQPADVQNFLLRTSILDRLCGSLCDALLHDATASGQATLELLERANLFIFPLDNERHWYRYHHLFAELLRQRLHQRLAAAAGEDGPAIAQLHKRASRWYEEHGLELEAFHHAVAADDVDHAARLVEGKGMPLHFRGAAIPVLNWLRTLPATALDERPALWVIYASALLFVGQLSDVEQKLQAAEAALSDSEPDDKIGDLLGHIASIRATLAVTQHQVETIVAQSQRALALLHPDNLPVRTATTWTLGYAYQLQGDRAAAGRAYTAALAASETIGHLIITLMATLGIGRLQEAATQLGLAVQSYRRVLQLAGDPPLPVACDAHLGLARICYERNDLAAAQQHGEQSLQLARQLDKTDRFVACEILLARLQLAQGDVAGATARLAKTSQLAHQFDFVRQLPELAAAQVLSLLRQGKVAAAAQLAQSHELPLSRARLDLAQANPAAALALLAAARQQAEAKDWADERLKAMVLQTLAFQALGRPDQAVDLLAEVLALAEPDGFVRTFIDEGLPMAQLLSTAAARGIKPVYVRQLLAGFEAKVQPRAEKSAQPLVEPLSQRELEVLQLIAQGLSNHEIGERLFLALSSVKGHNQRIFAKLQVQRRTEAVARARELGLL
jgi:LuxR family transcriptional regulator, maltose regulon positive regulatory protein